MRPGADWQDAVNMTANELEHFLGTEESKSVGDMGLEGESTGHRSGKAHREAPPREEGRPDRGRRRSYAQGGGLRAPAPRRRSLETSANRPGDIR